jgi:hypothetical protein
MANRTKEKPTLREIYEREDIPERDRVRMGELVVRLIQIQSEMKALEEERGYTDSDKKRHPGLADELEDLYVKYDVQGIRVEDFQAIQKAGSRYWIDRNLLLAEGVTPDQINAATMESHWTGIEVRKDRGRE